MKKYFALLTSLALFVACESDDDPDAVSHNEHKLKSVTSYFDTSFGYKPGDSTVYSYNNVGQLIAQKYFTYEIVEEEFQLFSIDEFTYDNKKLVKILHEIVVPNGHTSTTTYEYQGDKIKQILLDDDIDTEATLSYPHKDTIEIKYRFNNGREFLYRFSTVDHNISFEETYDGETLASETINEFDNKLNPYSLLGYTDIFFTNFSKNNKTKTTSEYYAIGFPNSVPSDYHYEYNDHNLPTEQITTYETYPDGNFSGRSKTIFEYFD